jgi:pyruvyltransferase
MVLLKSICQALSLSALTFLSPQLLASQHILSTKNESFYKGLPLFYWDARLQLGFANFGDALSEALVERIIGNRISVTDQSFNGEKKLLGMGSIMHYAQNNDVIWGTGVNGKAADKSYRFTDLDVRAVRGPLTREFLLKRGITCPEVYGDPTLLLPKYFPEFQKAAIPSHEFIIIPHFSDENLFIGLSNVVSAKEHWNVVVQKILDSKFVISSSLSGIIVAEAFGIPARLLQIENKSNTEDLFKYKDYYFGTGRMNFKYATSIEEALEMGGESLPICDLEKLDQAFPVELFR